MPIVDPRIDGYEKTITDRFGHRVPWKAYWVPNNWMTITASLPWVYSDIINVKKVMDIDGVEYPERKPKYTDNDHILIFPQDVDGICPRSWIEVTWPFIEKFRSAFTLYPEQAGLYKNITLIGHPNVTPHIDDEYVEAILNSSWRNVERILCRSSERLSEILQSRIDDNVFFRGENEE